MDVTREQCSGHSLIDLFWCPICKKFIRHMKFHDGGFNQPFCKRPFCALCLEEKITPVKSFSGPLVLNRVNCPIRECGMPLQSNMIRGSSKMEDIWYNSIQINCVNCLQNFCPENYFKHIMRCPGKQFVPFVIGEPLPESVLFSVNNNQKRNLIISDDASPKDTGLVTYERYLDSKKGITFNICFSGTTTKVRVRPDVSVQELLETLKKAYNFSCDVDLMYVAHRSLLRTGSVVDFLSVLPVGSPINFTMNPKIVNSKAKQLEFIFTQGIPRDSCLYGQEIPDDVPN